MDSKYGKGHRKMAFFCLKNQLILTALAIIIRTSEIFYFYNKRNIK